MLVYVPNAYDIVWQPYLTKIEYIDNGIYYCKIRQRNLSSFNSLDNEFVYPFKQVFEDRESCQDYIDKYYYDGLCKGCKYADDAGTILNCSMCSHMIQRRNSDPTKYDSGYCKYSGISVWSARNPCIGKEICKNFSPSLPQYQDWSWLRYDDMLRNCEFNKECTHHKYSAYKNLRISYDKYMSEYIQIPVDDKNIESLYIKRSEWIDQSFVLGNGRYKYHGVKYKPELTRSGHIKKGTANKSEFFDEVRIWDSD